MTTTAQAIFNKTIDDECQSMSAFELTENQCAEVEQDWDSGDATYTFEDDSKLIFSENEVKIG